MTAPEIAERLKAKFPDAVLDLQAEARQPWLKVKAQGVAEICRALHDEPDFRFDALMCLSGVDYPNELACVYHLFSYMQRHTFILKVNVPKSEPHVPSVSGIWRGADWFEREAYDLLGIIFDGHPDLRRLMMPEDWMGHPLRKDYKEPERYLGMDMPRAYPTASVEEPKKVA